MSSLENEVDYQHFMTAALDQATQALEAGEFPVGCVLVHQYRVIASGQRRGTAAGGRNETDHAEMMALQAYYALENAPDPNEITAFCTMEPCLMCLASLVLSGIRTIVYGYEDVMGGAARCDDRRVPASWVLPLP